MALLISAIALVVTPVASAKSNKGKHKHKQAVGAVYTETNDPSGNELVVLTRYKDGTLKQTQVVSTGGNGARQNQPGCGPPGGCPFLDTQDAVRVSPNGKLVFAVNAGSNTVSSFRIKHGKAKLVDQDSSGGTFPHSLTISHGLLYVLNGNSSNISGLRYSNKGAMGAIPGSSKALTGVPPSASCPPPLGPACGSRDISFDRNGKFVVVTELAASQLEVFPIDSSGKPGTGVVHQSQVPLPFGLAFDQRNTLVDTELTPDPTKPGATSTYGLGSSGALTNIDSKSSNGAAPCWVRITNSGKFAFVVNAGGGPPASIARFGLSPSGQLTLLGNVTRPEFALTDETLSRDSKFLYVVAPGNLQTGADETHILEYKVSHSGGLKLIGTTPSNLAIGTTGLDGR